MEEEEEKRKEDGENNKEVEGRRHGDLFAAPYLDVSWLTLHDRNRRVQLGAQSQHIVAREPKQLALEDEVTAPRVPEHLLREYHLQAGAQTCQRE